MSINNDKITKIITIDNEYRIDKNVNIYSSIFLGYDYENDLIFTEEIEIDFDHRVGDYPIKWMICYSEEMNKLIGEN